MAAEIYFAWQKYWGTHSPGDLESLITVLQTHLEATPSNSALLNNLGTAFGERFKITRSEDDFDMAVAHQMQAMSMTAEEDRGIWHVRTDFVRNLSDWYELADTTAEMHEADTLLAKLMEEAEKDESISQSHPLRTRFNDFLSQAVFQKCKRSGDSQEFGQLIMRLQISSLSPEMRQLYHEAERLQNTDSIDELSAAITQYDAKSLSAQRLGDDRARSLYESLVYDTLYLRLKISGTDLDLERLIMLTHEQLTRSSDPRLLSNLVNLSLRKFDRTGSVEILTEAVAKSELALQLLPPNSRQRVPYLSIVASARSARFERTGSTEDLERAIQLTREVLASIPNTHPDRAGYLLNLGRVLEDHGERSESTDDLDEAVECHVKAHELMPSGLSGERASLLTGLSIALQKRFRVTESEEDLNRAIGASKAALDCLPDDHSVGRAASMSELGLAFRQRFQSSNAVTDIDDAITALRGALDLTPADHAERSQRLMNLGFALLQRLPLAFSEKDLLEATTHLSNVVNMRFAPPTMRIEVARSIAGILLQTGMIECALPLLETAVGLLPSISPRSLSRVDQQRQLSSFKGLASDAAAAALDFGETPVNVVRLLDSGRGILQGHILNIRSDIKGLPEDLANEWETLKALLDPQKLEGSNPDPQGYRQADSRHQLNIQLDHLLEKIRKCENGRFANFGLQLDSDTILEQAQEGPIVILNINQQRSDALIVTESEVICHALFLEIPTVELNVQKFRKAIEILTRPRRGIKAL
jgi:tetratricopeptide (TPR) repeat protein